MDPRHKKRIKIVQELYSYSFSKKNSISSKTKEILKKDRQLKKLIGQAARKYEINRIAKVDLAILRLSIFEMIFEKQNPHKVVINEAIELAKELAGESSPGFINAVLGKIYDLKKTKN